MLALCVTGSAAVLGFSDKLPHHLIPYILSPLLLVTSRIAYGNWLLQHFNAAFLLRWFEDHYDSLVYEGAYTHLFIQKSSPNTLCKRAKQLLDHTTKDFALLNIMTFCASFYFSLPTLNTWMAADRVFPVIAYAIPFIAMHALAALIQYRTTTRSTLQLSREIDNYLKTANNALEATSNSAPSAPSEAPQD